MSEEKKAEGKVTEAQKAPRSQTKGDTPQPQLRTAAGSESAFAGDNQVKVNPALNANSVSLPLGVSDEGVSLVETYYAGELYFVNDDALEVKNTEELNFLVAVE